LCILSDGPAPRIHCQRTDGWLRHVTGHLASESRCRSMARNERGGP